MVRSVVDSVPCLLLTLCFLWVASPALMAQSAKDASFERRIMSGDRLRITVQEAPDMEGVYPVAGDGSIDFPLIGRITIEDLSTEEIAALLEERLTQSYFREATVSVDVSDYVTGSILIMGEINDPGEIPFSGDQNLTLVEAISRRGGLTREAKGTEVRIVRWKPGGSMERQIITVDFQSMIESLDFTKDQFLRPRDMVIVPRLDGGEGSSEFLVLGEVVDPGFHPFTENMDVIRAVTRAGGFTRWALLESSRLLRSSGDGQYTVMTMDLARLFGGGDMTMNVKMKPGDIIFIPSQEQNNRGVVYILGAVLNKGAMALPLDSEMTVSQAIMNAGGIDKFGNDSKVKVLRDGPDGNKQTIEVDVGRILKTGLFEDDLPLRAGDVVIVPERIFSI